MTAMTSTPMTSTPMTTTDAAPRTADITRAEISQRAAALFAAIDDYADDAAFIAEADALAAELPAGDADGLFHRACARHSRGYPDQAIPLYREALDRAALYRAALDTGSRSSESLGPESPNPGQPSPGSLSPEHRRRAVIQLASSLRNTGEAAAALALLEAERGNGSDDLDDALACVTALCLASLGREREGLSLVLVALAPHLPRYNRSMAGYGRALLEEDSSREGVSLRRLCQCFTVEA